MKAIQFFSATVLISVLPLFAADIPALQAKAKSGDADAQLELARVYLKGDGIAKDPARAFDLASAAAAQGDVEAKATLGYLFLSGIGTTKDEEKGIQNLKDAAQGGSPKASYNLAQILIKKGPDHSTKALELMTKASDAGVIEAEIALADWYYFGQADIPVDYQKAFPLYLRAADRGNAAAQNNVGSMLYDGNGTARDRKRGADYYLMSAQKGFARAQANVGNVYAMGDVLGKSKVEALKWFFLANVQGDVVARNSLKCFLKGVTSAQISEALKETGLDEKAATNIDDPELSPSAN